MKEQKDQYLCPPQLFESGDENVAVTLYRPALDEDERIRREKRMEKAAANLMRTVFFPKSSE